MIIISPTFKVLTDINGIEILKRLEKVARTCYKSEDKITKDSAERLIKLLVKKEHEAMLEHESISVKFICDRGISHELVRHRIASYAQESTRYCNYSKDKFDKQLTFIKPSFFRKGGYNYLNWRQVMQLIEVRYLKMLDEGATPEQARTILPNSLKTEIVVTMNLRAWRNFFKLRTDIAAHPQMRELTIPLLEAFKQKLPVVFEDINHE